MQAGLQVDVGSLQVGSCCLYILIMGKLKIVAALGMTAASCVWCDAQVLCMRCKQLEDLALSTWLVPGVSVEPVMHDRLMINSKTH